MKELFKYYIVLLILPAIILLTGCAELEEEVELAGREVRDKIPSQQFSDATITHTKRGDTTFVVNAPTILRYDKINKTELLGGIRVSFYEDGRISSILTAEYGEVLRNGKEMYAEGDVVVETDSGTVMQSPRLFWSAQTNEITTDTTVYVETSKDTLYGTGMIASDDLTNIRILRPSGISHRKGTDQASKKTMNQDIPENKESNDLDDDNLDKASLIPIPNHVAKDTFSSKQRTKK